MSLLRALLLCYGWATFPLTNSKLFKEDKTQVGRCPTAKTGYFGSGLSSAP